MELRYYQEEAKQAVYRFFRERPHENPCVVLPTGAGKTPLLASLCEDIVVKERAASGLRKRVLVVSHVKELLEQACDKIHMFCPQLNVGVYSAGLNSRDTTQDVIVAGVQSIYNKAPQLGAFDVVIIDECHLIPPEGEGRYQTLLRALRRINPAVKLVGLTATPYRLKTGMLCGPENFLNDICYEVDIRTLIKEGFLCRLESRFTQSGVETDNLHIRAGEFVQEEVDELVNNDEIVNAECSEVIEKFHRFNRSKCLLFAVSVSHAERIKREIEELTGMECGIVLGDTDTKSRARTLKRFKEGALRFLVNVSVLTTGFDDPSVDLIALMRPTASPGLYYQMCGRGLRVAAGKDYCLILDFGQNIERHGPLDCIEVKKPGKGRGHAPVKHCPICGLYCHISVAECPSCRFVFPFSSRLTGASSRKDVISKQVIDYHLEVERTEYSQYVGKGGKVLIKANHILTDGTEQPEWLCPEHPGYPRQQFEAWWRVRSDVEPPKTVRRALRIMGGEEFKRTYELVVRYVEGELYNKIIGWSVHEHYFHKDTSSCYNCTHWDEKKDYCDVVKNMVSRGMVCGEFDRKPYVDPYADY